MHATRTPIIDRKVRFALVGCGRIAKNHFEAIDKHTARREPTAVAAKRDGLVKQAGCQAYDHHE